MKLIRKNANFLGVFMATLMLLIAVPYPDRYVFLKLSIRRNHLFIPILF